MRIVVFASSKETDISYINEYISNDDYIIACDGGLETIDKLGIMPKVLIGDFDSVSKEIFDKYENIEKIKFKEEKDFSDFEAVISYCKKIEHDEIIVFGVTGGRMDHTLSNISLLCKNIDLNMKYIDKNNVTFATDRTIEIYKTKDYLSFIPISQKCVISIEGVKYELTERDISDSATFTVSNEITSKVALLTMIEGSVIVVLSSDR